jgi:hypothetical protein
MTLPFNELVSSIANAAIEAQHLIRKDQIYDLYYNFFEKDKDGCELVPISWDLQIPNMSHDTKSLELKPKTVKVPLMILTNHSQLSIQEMQVTMLVNMCDIAEPDTKDTAKSVLMEDNSKEHKEKACAQPHKWESKKRPNLIHASTISGGKQGETGTAHVVLKMTTGETPEGLAKLMNHLNKCL